MKNFKKLKLKEKKLIKKYLKRNMRNPVNLEPIN